MAKDLHSERVLVIPEDFSVAQVDEFRKAVNQLITAGEIRLMLDFKNCNYIDSTGLGVIVAVYKKCKEAGGNIKLRTMKPKVKNLFELTRLDRVFEIND